MKDIGGGASSDIKAVVNNRISPASTELLIRERSKGKSLRLLGQMFGRSHERIRQLLAKFFRSASRLSPFEVQLRAGKVEREVYSLGTFIEKLRAGGAGRKSGCLQNVCNRPWLRWSQRSDSN